MSTGDAAVGTRTVIGTPPVSTSREVSVSSTVSDAVSPAQRNE